mmetsp:Transcript_10082/g.13212  ORF Transcript_10082/g.13212 Transcript_10082/m.13212 type:complete len:355 (-) Transcript_10082:119-1183(-)|eukprot:CAMPEP_0184014394 /NCGR_PEP_ID=MMETSP0954-20121128/5623_1 /TAXON_ID=627963 /ORGANISM="Aplanochytrium sp, Strain PBS07" /LENGTH=354 /DNA_ID=CAMNT_0026294847 /DNA_START=35 /DNA_END=1099 /DNA_ORIENTATION=-
MSEWCTIESDPGVFTELIQTIGVKNIQVEELYSLDEDTFAKLSPVYGLIFLFKWKQEKDDREYITSPDEDLFFASQVIHNACATQAILSILLNCPDIDVGEDLNMFRSFTKSFSSQLKGEAIGDCASVRNAHNSFARPEPFLPEESKRATKDDDVFHFIAYIPFKGKVYELDGLKPGPLILGDVGKDDDWLTAVKPHIEKRIQSYGQEIRFNLMAIIKDQRVVLTECKTKTSARIEKLEKAIASSTSPGDDSSMECTTISLKDDEAFETMLAEKNAVRLQDQLEFEMAALGDYDQHLKEVEQKFQLWKNENIRRRHNYIPFVVSMLKILAKRKRLEPMVQNAVKKKQERHNAAK